MIEVAIWVIVVLLGAIVYIVWHGLQIVRAQHQSTMTALASLGDTHRLGYDALTLYGAAARAAGQSAGGAALT